MLLLLDQGLPRSTVPLLQELGLAAEHIGDLGMSAAEDREILALAIRKQAVVATLDSDFHSLLAAQGQKLPSVIRIRIEGLRGERVAAILAQVVSEVEEELNSGAVVSVTPHRIRVRSLPIGREPENP